jgi:two-component system, chemotaxis family, sensor kinase CheA
MNTKASELLSHLLATFQVEAREHIGSISARLVDLEQAPDPEHLDAALEIIYRCTHSLKGGARIVNLTLVEFLCQAFEECLAAIRRGELSVTPSMLDLMHETTSAIEKILLSPTPNAPATSLKSAAIKLRQRLDDSIRQDTKPQQPATTPEVAPSALPASCPPPDAGLLPRAPAEPPLPERRRPMAAETVRVPAARLDELMLQAEEMVVLKLGMQQHIRGVKEVMARLAHFRLAFSGADSLDRDAIREMDRTLATISSSLAFLQQCGEDDHRQASGMVENLIADAKNLLLFPFSSVTEGFNKLVREMAREQGKEVELRLSGEGIELDRRILQELKDPLVHLVRNCIDHGIETAADRRIACKPLPALITISAVCIDSGKIEIVIRDNGRGIDADHVKAAAIKLGIIVPDVASALSDDEARQLVFRSGLSTRGKVTTISGRGLGLAIAAERVEKLGGSIFLESTPDAGTSFRLVIPLSMATFRGIHLRVGEYLFAIATLNVLKVCRVRAEELNTVGNRQTLVLDRQVIPVVALAAILGIHAGETGESGFRTLMILGSGKDRAAFQLDEVIGEDDLLVKGLGPQLVRVRNISGATVLANGAVAPILNAMDLIKSALGGHAHPHMPPPEGADVKTGKSARRILVVDDSITSRTLLKNVLESYGYDVTTAVDGFDALTALQESRFDLVSSDVEMPRMDGFELTARVRADERFSRLPVVLVTSMDSPEDRKKGINAGADAYIVKSSFDQGNLLDTIRRLI